MSRRYTKEDVQFHSDEFGRASRPAVNVKVYRSLWDVRFPLEDASPELTREWIEEHLSDEQLDALFWHVCEWEFEALQADAEEIFGAHVKVYAEGRSGGWAVVDGLADIEDWDAVDLAKWRRFERYAKQHAHGIPEQMVYSIDSNEFEAWRAEQAEEAGVHVEVSP